jgi:diguanylate cyclase (GGDEF)-like protein/PAS domain S-box-containing protein
MNPLHIRILLVEDEIGDAHLVKMALKQSPEISSDITWVESLALAKCAFDESHFDVILLDLSLPDSNGLDTVKKAKKISGDVPIVILTGHGDTEFALMALKEGATDYMVKGDFGFNGLARVIRYALLRVEMEAHNKLLVAALEAAANGIVITDKCGQIKWSNPAFSDLTGYSFHEVVGRKPSELVKSGKQSESFYQDMWAKLLVGEYWRGEVINKHKDGRLYHEDLSISPVKNSRGEIVNFIGIKQDISERKALDAMLQKLANTDPLTGLFNRRVFLERLAQESNRISRLGGSAIMLMLDLDFFKRVNDTYGHAIGDEVLKGFAEIVRKNTRNIDVPARFGGEEFAILLPSTSRDEADVMAERLRKQVAEMVIACPTKEIVKITVSIGAASLSLLSSDGEAALRHADSALYRAKESGRNKICWHQTQGQEIANSEN